MQYKYSKIYTNKYFFRTNYNKNFKMEDYNRPIWQLTIGEFVEILDGRKQESSENPTQEKVFNEKYVYGLSGLASLLGCSKNHAGKLKSKGIFDKAIIQNGRKIIIDSEKALELFKDNS